LPKIHDLVKSNLREKQLTFVDQKARFHFLRLDSLHNLVERHRHRFDIRLKEFESEVGGRSCAGDGDFLSGQLVFLDWMRRDHDRAVALAETRSAIEQDILIRNKRVAVKAHGCHVVGFLQRGVV
jgi:hypothetical protein